MKEKDGGGRTKKMNNVPVQSGSGAVPGRMRREYPVADFEAAAAAVRKGKKKISFPGGGKNAPARRRDVDDHEHLALVLAERDLVAVDARDRVVVDGVGLLLRGGGAAAEAEERGGGGRGCLVWWGGGGRSQGGKRGEGVREQGFLFRFCCVFMGRRLEGAPRDSELRDGAELPRFQKKRDQQKGRVQKGKRGAVSGCL